MSPTEDIQISIVVVNWNTQQVTRDCLESVLENLGELATNRRVEIFVVDNASTDGSQTMVRECFAQVRLIENTENRGFATANNQAIRLATGQYVLLLNSDTIVLGDVLQESVRYLDEHPDVGVMGCRVLNEDRTVQFTCSRYPSLINMFLSSAAVSNLRWPRFFGREHMLDWKRDTEREVDVVTGCYMLVRKTAIEQVGLLDEAFFFCGEETDWCRRFKNAGWKLKFAPVGEIVHIGNVSGRKRGHRRDIMLSEGLVRFIWKHEGRCSAALAWSMLWWFSFSHGLVWGVISLVAQKQTAKDRSASYLRIARGFFAAWPNSVKISENPSVAAIAETSKRTSRL